MPYDSFSGDIVIAQEITNAVDGYNSAGFCAGLHRIISTQIINTPLGIVVVEDFPFTIRNYRPLMELIENREG